jgi:hypothetical protein
MTADWAGGGLVSTTEDLNVFLRAFVRNEIFSNSSTKNTMLTWVESGPLNNYGLGNWVRLTAALQAILVSIRSNTKAARWNDCVFR